MRSKRNGLRVYTSRRMDFEINGFLETWLVVHRPGTSRRHDLVDCICGLSFRTSAFTSHRRKCVKSND